MRVSVDSELCQGHTRCASFAAAVFGLRPEDGHAVVLVDEVPPGQETAVLKAIEGCPERALAPLPG
jgi:ferredoxin